MNAEGEKRPPAAVSRRGPSAPVIPPEGGQAERADDGTGEVSARKNSCRNADGQEPPEFGASRRRFLIAALMAGWIKPERVVERVVAEVAEDANGAR